MDGRTDWIEPDSLIRIYFLVSIVIFVTITVSPLYHPTILALMFIISFFGYYSIILPKTNQIKQRRFQETERAKRVQRALALKEEGIDHYLNGYYHDAIELLYKSVNFNGGDAESLKYLGLSYLTLHNYKMALEYLKRARNINPDDGEANKQITRIESHLEFNQSVRKFYNKKTRGG